MWGHMGKPQGQSGGRGGWGETGARAFVMVSGKGKARPCMQVKNWLVQIIPVGSGAQGHLWLSGTWLWGD